MGRMIDADRLLEMLNKHSGNSSYDRMIILIVQAAIESVLTEDLGDEMKGDKINEEKRD